MDDLNKMTDEALVVEYKEKGNQVAAQVLYERYKGIVTLKAKSMYLAGGEREDLIQEGMIGLFNAVRDYDVEHNTQFSTFAGICIERQMLNAVTANNRKKNIPLNQYISYDSNVSGTCEDSMTLLEIIEADSRYNPENVMMDNEAADAIRQEATDKLSDFEKEVFALKLAGKDYRQIGEILGKTPKSIDNALTRIKQKISEK